ncbi:bacteriophage abortive infection AbiH family protein [Clostridium gasigenes]|uniref:Bacteriophage abortive infection AbiH n=1 Tax=Clostridium gasigenes TaxID=94869 RepID=A0A1H0VCN4_9CLOT|nr:bacteriophage abortive infection AbiH family protein [Clostridium gasigenes]SDP76227.1 Bacteriophage abortive infection AbiH [Clostridium gasigenes]
MNLFVIGNGFDLAHGLKTLYGDFRDYLEEEDWSYLEALENMYGFCIDSKKEWVKEYLWKDFETNLSNIDEATIIDGGEYMDLGLEGGDIGVEDTLDEYWQEQYGFIERLNEFVMSWIKKIDIDTTIRTDVIDADTSNKFITFNYTLLLEEMYKVDKYNILHIHGSIDEDDTEPVIGHGNKEKMMQFREVAKEASEEYYEKKSSIYNAVANYYERTLKNVDYFLMCNRSFFKKLEDVKSISVIGHSLGDVDMPYFKGIKENVNKDTIWNIYYRDEGDDICFKNKIMSIGVNEDKIRVLHSEQFFNTEVV